jgi:hypothetical protein
VGLVGIDAARFRNSVGELMALARVPGGVWPGELLDGYLRSLRGHETVHFENPGARQGDAVFNGHRGDVRHDLLDEALTLGDTAGGAGGRRWPTRGRPRSRCSVRAGPRSTS